MRGLVIDAPRAHHEQDLRGSRICSSRNGFLACGSKEGIFFFVSFCGKPQNETNLNGFPPCRRRVGADTGHIRNFSPAAGRKELFISVVLAALPPKQRKKIVSSLLPQAKKCLAWPNQRRLRKS
jgi:hypothetical protein